MAKAANDGLKLTVQSISKRNHLTTTDWQFTNVNVSHQQIVIWIISCGQASENAGHNQPVPVTKMLIIHVLSMTEQEQPVLWIYKVHLALTEYSPLYRTTCSAIFYDWIGEHKLKKDQTSYMFSENWTHILAKDVL